MYLRPFRLCLFRHQTAITLIEAAIALGVAGLVVGGIWAAANQVNRAVQTKLLAEDVHQIVDNVRGLYLNRNTMTIENTAPTVNGAVCGAAAFNSRLSCLGVYPASLVPGAAGNNAFHEWDRGLVGGSVRITPRAVDFSAGGAGGATSFAVQLWNLPQNVCVDLIATLGTPDQKYDLKAVLFYNNALTMQAFFVTVNTPPDWTLGGTRGTLLPMTPTQAVAACLGNSVLEFVYGLRGGA